MTLARRSRCQEPTSPPLTWSYYGTVGSELSALVADLTRVEKLARYAELKALLNAAAQGELEDDPDLKPVQRDPRLWELRWRFGGRPWRMYHTEPDEMTRHLVALKFHQKVDTCPPEYSDAQCTRHLNRLQDRDIDDASARFDEGWPTLWGHL